MDGHIFYRVISRTCQRLRTNIQTRIHRGKRTASSLPPKALPYTTKYRAHRISSEPPPKPAARSFTQSLRAFIPGRNGVFWFINTFIVFHLFTKFVGTLKLCVGPSMLPTILYADEWVYVSKLHAWMGWITVGDLVSYHHPVRRGVYGTKRVIGMPGDFVLRDTPESGSDAMVRVPPGHCWVTGDNLPGSRDSRMFGALPLALVRGRVLFTFWPNPRWFETDLTEPVILKSN